MRNIILRNNDASSKLYYGLILTSITNPTTILPEAPTNESNITPQKPNKLLIKATPAELYALLCNFKKAKDKQNGVNTAFTEEDYYTFTGVSGRLPKHRPVATTNSHKNEKQNSTPTKLKDVYVNVDHLDLPDLDETTKFGEKIVSDPHCMIPYSLGESIKYLSQNSMPTLLHSWDSCLSEFLAKVPTYDQKVRKDVNLIIASFKSVLQNENFPSNLLFYITRKYLLHLHEASTLLAPPFVLQNNSEIYKDPILGNQHFLFDIQKQILALHGQGITNLKIDPKAKLYFDSFFEQNFFFHPEYNKTIDEQLDNILNNIPAWKKEINSIDYTLPFKHNIKQFSELLNSSFMVKCAYANLLYILNQSKMNKEDIENLKEGFAGLLKDVYDPNINDPSIVNDKQKLYSVYHYRAFLLSKHLKQLAKNAYQYKDFNIGLDRLLSIRDSLNKNEDIIKSVSLVPAQYEGLYDSELHPYRFSVSYPDINESITNILSGVIFSLNGKQVKLQDLYNECKVLSFNKVARSFGFNFACTPDAYKLYIPQLIFDKLQTCDHETITRIAEVLSKLNSVVSNTINTGKYAKSGEVSDDTLCNNYNAYLADFNNALKTQVLPIVNLSLISIITNPYIAPSILKLVSETHDNNSVTDLGLTATERNALSYLLENIMRYKDFSEKIMYDKNDKIVAMSEKERVAYLRKLLNLQYQLSDLVYNRFNVLSAPRV